MLESPITTFGDDEELVSVDSRPDVTTCSYLLLRILIRLYFLYVPQNIVVYQGIIYPLDVVRLFFVHIRVNGK